MCGKTNQDGIKLTNQLNKSVTKGNNVTIIYMDVVIGATPVVVTTILKLRDSNKVWRVSTNSKRTEDLEKFSKK